MRPPTTRRRWLILPIEIKVRELDGKLLLAATAADRGWGVIIGHKDDLATDTEAIKGVVLEKDGNVSNRRIGRYQEMGKIVCALDEEGLVYLNSEDYYRRRLSEGGLQRLERFFLWGRVQERDILERVPGIAGKLVLTGNPRFDLLRPGLRTYYSPEAQRLRNRFGPFLLVNTNFADSNHYMGTEWVIQNLRRSGFITNAGHEANERAFIAYQATILEGFIQMVQRLGPRFPDHRIIIRPHPSELHERWAAIARASGRLKVIHEGDVNPWLLAADLAIHNGCMTGIHGFLLETPTIAYRPVKSDRFDYYLPNALSTEAETLDELFAIVEHVIADGNSGMPDQRIRQMAVAEQYLTSVSGPLAAERIMDSLEQLEVEPDAYTPAMTAHPARAAPGEEDTRNAGRIVDVGRQIAAKARTGLTLVKDRKQRMYSRQKYPGITLEEIEARLGALRLASGRFGSVEARQHGRQSFCIVSRPGAM